MEDVIAATVESLLPQFGLSYNVRLKTLYIEDAMGRLPVGVGHNVLTCSSTAVDGERRSHSRKSLRRLRYRMSPVFYYPGLRLPTWRSEIEIPRARPKTEIVARLGVDDLGGKSGSTKGDPRDHTLAETNNVAVKSTTSTFGIVFVQVISFSLFAVSFSSTGSENRSTCKCYVYNKLRVKELQQVGANPVNFVAIWDPGDFPACS